jgi:hypothetical protein
MRVVSACSGLGTECFALKALSIRHRLVLAAERVKHLRDFLRENHKPEILSRDVMGNGFQRSGADADLFVAGFPCQPFSAAGSNKGERDGRGQLGFAIIKWIQRQRPRSFILENVQGLATKHKPTFRKMIQKLRRIQQAPRPQQPSRTRKRGCNSQQKKDDSCKVGRSDRKRGCNSQATGKARSSLSQFYHIRWKILNSRRQGVPQAPGYQTCDPP